MRDVWLEINLKAIEENCRKLIDSTQVDLIAVVKANGYGHGLSQTAKACERGGARILAVNDFDEASEIRRSGIRLPVLILNPLPSEFVREMIENDFIYSLSDAKSAGEINEEARRLGKKLKINFCLDTGMHRFGVMPEDLDDFLETCDKYVNLDAEGAFSHFADPKDKQAVNRQLQIFNDMLFQCGRQGYNFKYTHISRSGSLDNEDSYFDTIRCGLSLYGYSDYIDLTKALEFKSQIIFVKKIPKGEKVGYGLTYTTKQATTLAVTPVGYIHGYDRRFSNKAEVLVNYKKCKIIGRVCMGHILIDITGVNAKVGDEVVLIGKQGEIEISANDLANLVDTSPHEILASLPRNIERVYNNE